MIPGHWYNRNTLTNAGGLGRDARGSIVRTLLQNALVTRARGPEAGQGSLTRPKPEWLYTLTPNGEALRELRRLLR
jgi:hypothetical protein